MMKKLRIMRRKWMSLVLEDIIREIPTPQHLELATLARSGGAMMV